MVTINLAYTAPINPSGAEPVLTPDQVWAGLQRKVRRAYEFVSVIASCEVLKEEGNRITREVQFKEGSGPPGPPRPVKEVCDELAPCRVDFRQEDGSTISNIVSNGPSQAETDLYMTYAFEWRRPDLEAGSEEEKSQMERYKKMSKVAVEGSIDAIRRLVKEGEIK